MHGVTRKRSTKRLKIKGYRKSLSTEPKVNRCLLILLLRVIYIVGQRKVFYRQRIPESSCARKENVHIDNSKKLI